MSTDEDVPQVFSLANAQEFAREQLDKIPPTKYEVSPQQAYKQAGNPRGSLMGSDMVCRSCDSNAVFYSESGFSEIHISSMCEPCFDYTMVAVDDREQLDQWMTLVQYKKKDD